MNRVTRKGRKFSATTFTAIIAIATAFTLNACSSDDGGGSPPTTGNEDKDACIAGMLGDKSNTPQSIAAGCGVTANEVSAALLGSDISFGQCSAGDINPEHTLKQIEKDCNATIVAPSSSSGKADGKSSSSGGGEFSGNSLTDSRDGKKYKVVQIGTQIWMAENLRYAVAGSKCWGEGGSGYKLGDGEHVQVTISPEEIQANCNTYGPLYDWTTAKSICPSGWHLPTKAEWEILLKYVYPSWNAGFGNDAGIKLKASSGWDVYTYGDYTYIGNGTDDYGFAALPGGEYDYTFYSLGSQGYWWSATENEDEAGKAYLYNMMNYNSSVALQNLSNTYFASVRCINDNAAEPIKSSSSSSVDGGSSSSSATDGSSSSVGGTDVISSSSGATVSNRGLWLVYTDESDASSTVKGTSTVANAKDTDGNYIALMQDGGEQVAKISNYSLGNDLRSTDGYYYAPSAAMNLLLQGTSYQNLMSCEEGISYSYKGPKHIFMAILSTVTDSDFHLDTAYASEEWKIATIPFAKLKQSGWGITRTFNKSALTSFTWEVRGLTGVPKTGSLAVKDIQCSSICPAYDNVTQFCSPEGVLDKCGGKEYNPSSQKCGVGNVVETQCGTEWYKETTQFCTANGVLDKCGGKEYEPANQRCNENNVVETSCGTGWYNAANQRCGTGNIIETQCGTNNWYDTSNEDLRCQSNGNVEASCGTAWYNIASQRCQNEAIENQCGTAWYNNATHFCFAGSGSSKVGERCGSRETFDPDLYECRTGDKIYLKQPITYVGESYEAVLIGTQTWLAKNLNYNAGEGSVCYDDEDSNCEEYGRLYNWATAMNLEANCNSNSCSSQIQTKHRGICPSGWHIPTSSEWTTLTNYIYYNVATALKAIEGWLGGYTGTDNYGFAALPGGYGTSSSSFSYSGNSSYWWSASQYDYEWAYNSSISYSNSAVSSAYNNYKTYLYSIRCVMD